VYFVSFVVKTKGKPMPSDLELRNYFKFDESDLAANRAGRLSAKQNARLMEADEGSSKIFVWIGWGMLALDQQMDLH